LGVITWIIWGLFVGAFARLLRRGGPRLGIAWTIMLGIGGSVLGGLLATEVLGIGDTDESDFGSFVIAVITSVALLAVVDRLDRALPDRKRRDRVGDGRRDRLGE
jgi:uncharacterized membrane protein YeaQ/YmgE (transglycosylase-associated protein family)